ncbi:MAG TPA: Chromate resistance protein ChrB [Negativicutes bacterium]
MRKWLVISYNLPTEPSRIRVAAWRGLRKQGAVNIQKSLWVLPYSEGNYSVLATLAEELENNNGDVIIMESVFFEEKYEQKIISIYNKARTLEYEEIIDKCNDFFVEIEKETIKENLTFAEAEENEEELNKLLSWFNKINVRDIFDAPHKEETETALEKCKKVFEEFHTKVFDKEAQERT